MAHLQDDVGWCADCRRRVVVWRGGTSRPPFGHGITGAMALLGSLVRQPWRCDRCGGTRVRRSVTAGPEPREYDTSDY
jgi:hypothetical protein